MGMFWYVEGINHYRKPFYKCGYVNELKGVVRVVADLPEGVITRVKAEIPMEVKEAERIFMNGYQTWTYSPEYQRNDKMRGVSHLPRVMIDRFSLDRYGDYHFIDYYDEGNIHGFSWAYVRDVDRYRLIASIDEMPGYTTFHYSKRTRQMKIKRDCEGIACNGPYHLFDLYFAEGSEKEVFDGWFEQLGVKPRTTEKIAGYSSWYNHYEDINEQIIGKDLEGCKGLFQKNDLFQIDDGWEPYVGDWLMADFTKFPGGMKQQADKIHQAGFRAGLWLAPFVAEKESYVFRNHPDWFIHVDGQPWINGSNWSGFYSLDIDNPEVVSYLKEVFHQVFDEWGFDLVKLDFLYGIAPFGSATETRAAKMTRAMDMLREWCGDHLILGCGVPLVPSFGKVDYCRISCDVTLDWNDKRYMQIIHRERPSTKQAITNIITRRALHNRAYVSDPDVFFLRDTNCKLPTEQKDYLAQLDALLGGVWLMSDNPSEYDEEKRKKYYAYRELLRAENVEVHDESGVISYDLDGEHHIFYL